LNLSFKYTGATKLSSNAAVTDQMIVYTSINCGSTWNQRLVLKDTALIKSVNVTGVFIPAANNWITKTIALPASVATAGVRIKFKYTSGTFTNNFYLDDINFTGILSTNELTNAEKIISVIPNPTSENGTIKLLNIETNTAITITNIVGKIVLETNVNPNQEININHLSNGLYFVIAQSKKGLQTTKFIKE
jgi:hypothetical protein